MNNIDIDYKVEVIKTNRKKSVSIQLEGIIVKVRVPKSLSDNRINNLIKKRKSWIETKIKEYSQTPVIKPIQYINGEIFPYLGKNYKLKVQDDELTSIKLLGGHFIVTLPQNEIHKKDKIRKLVIKWYQQHAKIYLKEKTFQLSETIGVAPESVSIKNYRSRWGSCMSNGIIYFNWRIILAPKNIINYIIIHELCHLLEHNHSPKYWQIVEKHFPNWRDSRDWLKNNQNFLNNY